MIEKWKNIISLLPILSLSTVGLGYLFLHFFYSNIGIRIFSFISASEILLSFIPILPSIILVTTSVSGVLIFMFAVEKYSDEKIAKIKNKYFKAFLHLLSFGIIIILYQFYTYLPSMKNPDLQVGLAILILAIIFVVISFNNDVLKNFHILVKDLIIAGIFLIAVTINLANNKGKTIINNNSKKFEILTKRSKLGSDSLIYYGRTRDYTFLINKLDTMVMIIPNNQIIEETHKGEF